MANQTLFNRDELRKVAEPMIKEWKNEQEIFDKLITMLNDFPEKHRYIRIIKYIKHEKEKIHWTNLFIKTKAILLTDYITCNRKFNWDEISRTYQELFPSKMRFVQNFLEELSDKSILKPEKDPYLFVLETIQYSKTLIQRLHCVIQIVLDIEISNKELCHPFFIEDTFCPTTALNIDCPYFIIDILPEKNIILVRLKKGIKDFVYNFSDYEQDMDLLTRLIGYKIQEPSM